MNIELKDVDENAVQYIIDLIERDFKRNQGNSVRGFPLFQNVWTLSRRLQDALHMALEEERRVKNPPREKSDEGFDGFGFGGAAATKVIKFKSK